MADRLEQSRGADSDSSGASEEQRNVVVESSEVGPIIGLVVIGSS